MNDDERNLPTWTTLEGETFFIRDMKLGHLVATIKMVAAQLEKLRAISPFRAKSYEKKLLQLQAELDSRGDEIDRVQCIYQVLMKNRREE